MTAATEPPIRLALIGAGIFARDAHVPSLISHPDRFEIAAIYSRTRASAEALAAQLPQRTEIYTDLDALLSRADIEAVDILLPIQALPSAISQSMAAGKHLLSEKPVAADVVEKQVERAAIADILAVGGDAPGIAQGPHRRRMPRGFGRLRGRRVVLRLRVRMPMACFNEERRHGKGSGR